MNENFRQFVDHDEFMIKCGVCGFCGWNQDIYLCDKCGAIHTCPVCERPYEDCRDEFHKHPDNYYENGYFCD